MTPSHAVSPEVERFCAVQRNVLARADVEACSRFFPLDNPPLRTHLLEGGDGEPILFLHGGGGVAASWAPLLARVAPRFRFIAPDRPGCGLTDKLNYWDVADVRAHAVDFVEGVLDALGLDDAHVLGHSMGGEWALLFAIDRPERVRRLVLMGMPVGVSPALPLENRVESWPWVNLAFQSAVKSAGIVGTRL